jgi:mRNA interferase MazF
MLDKPMTVKVDKISPPFGRLEETVMIRVNRSLALFLGLAG